MNTVNYCRASAAVFTLVSAAHLLRALMNWPAQVGDWSFSAAVSWVAFAVAGALAAWGFRAAAR